MNYKVKVNKRVFTFLVILSILVAFIISSLILVVANKTEAIYKEVFADNIEEEIKNIEIIKEQAIPIYYENEIVVTENPIEKKYLGDFNLTAYCPCEICCEQWGGSPVGKTTSIGVGAYNGITFAVDPKVIPYGTALYIEGVGVGIATDCGGAIKGHRIDIYYSNHQDALNFGIGGGYAHAVYILE